jgi:6-phosphofructokinase 1
MNAAVRAVVRTGIDKGWDIFGVRHGYVGLIADNIIPLGTCDVGGIIQQGGTITPCRMLFTSSTLRCATKNDG